MRGFHCAALAAVAVIGFGSIASAADMPVKAPMAPPAYNWTGFYIGGNLGWAGTNESATATPGPSPGFGAPFILGAGTAGYGLLPTSYGLNGNSVIGGIHAGYNRQMSAWLVGIEGDFSYANLNTAHSQLLFGTFLGTPTSTFANLQVSATNHWLASLRGRVGYVWMNNWMLYGTGGVAFTESSVNAMFSSSNSLCGSCFPAGTAANATLSNTQVGYAVGAGLEWKFSQSWLARIEYLHYGFGGITGNVPFTGGNCTLAAGNCSWNASTSNLNIDSVRLGLSYKFN